jgi:cytochrome c-type biogenesis protein CcmH
VTAARERRLRRIGWLCMAAVLGVALLVGVSLDRAPTSEGDRFRNLTRSIACPVCDGQSVANSDSDSAKGIRARIAQRIGEGASDAEIRDELAGEFGEHILLTPGRSGLSSLVWTLPVAALVVALAGLAVVFHRWRGGMSVHASDEDRALVARARAPGDGPGERSGDGPSP